MAKLPALTGSWKQRRWASDLRARFLLYGRPAEVAARIVQSRTTAKWWIDHREMSRNELVAAWKAEEADIFARPAPQDVDPAYYMALECTGEINW